MLISNFCKSSKHSYLTQSATIPNKKTQFLFPLHNLIFPEYKSRLTFQKNLSGILEGPLNTHIQHKVLQFRIIFIFVHGIRTRVCSCACYCPLVNQNCQ